MSAIFQQENARANVGADTVGDIVGQVGMTLAAIAYGTPAQIKTFLADKKLATKGQWELKWLAADAGNQVFVAKDTRSGQLAVVIRGSVTDIYSEAFWVDWFEQDLTVLRMADWKYGGAPAGVQVSHGSQEGLDSLISLRGQDGTSLVEFLRGQQPFSWLTPVIGHSLGGALASMLAPYLRQQFNPGKQVLDFWPVTFAGPTAGNGAFANWLEKDFLLGLSRYHNTLDIVPHSWQALDWIASSFNGGPRLPLVLQGLVDAMKLLLEGLSDQYVQPGAGVPLTGTLMVNAGWFNEAGLQHGSSTYLKLVGAPPVFPQKQPESNS